MRHDQRTSKLINHHPLGPFIEEYITDRSVLDVGCVGNGLEQRYKTYTFVHDVLRQHASRVIGIDIQRDPIDQLIQEGYDVSCQNAETFSFDESFDVIFGGDVIEHLAKPGLFLDRCFAHIKPDGLLLLATPNPFCLNRLLSNLVFLENDPKVNPEHTTWVSPSVLRELMKRSNFQIESVRYVNSPKITKRWGSRLTDALCSLLGSNLRETIVVLARPCRE